MKLRRAKIIILLLLAIVTVSHLIYIYIRSYEPIEYFYVLTSYGLMAAFLSITWEENTRLKGWFNRTKDKLNKFRELWKQSRTNNKQPQNHQKSSSSINPLKKVK